MVIRNAVFIIIERRYYQYHGRLFNTMDEKTRSFNLNENPEKAVRESLLKVYDALVEKGYDPINQIVGYILSEDPTYITTYNNARSIVRHIDRDLLLQYVVKYYLEKSSTNIYWLTTENIYNSCLN